MGDASEPNKATIIVFAGTLDKVMAAFILATTMAAMGMQTTMFFTFWGLSVLKKKGARGSGARNWMQKMLGWMLPDGPATLPLSQLNMGGMGASMLKKIMAQKKMSSLDELIQTALELDVRMIACQTSMDAMGISREQLIDAVEVAGAATYVGEARNAAINLFIS
ncbi:MAG: DsrE/DsrF/DrsH-like family protein [Armatimonadota bacterium]